MRTGLKTFTALLCAGASLSALAGDNVIPVMDSESYLLGQMPAGSSNRERAQAVNGALYAVVAPLYITPPFLSYLRLFNAGAGEASFTIKVVGSGTATEYGTASYTVPTAAAIQLSMSNILVAANAVTRSAGDEQFSFYIQSPQALAGYQHVTYHDGTKFFDNASVCRYTIQDVVREASSQVPLNSVHTSILATAGFPSNIELHNYANAAVTYRFFVRDAASGSLVGQMDFPTRANASYTIPWSQIQSTVGFNPTASQVHANLIVTDPSGAPPAVVLGQTVVNNALGVSINLTTACAVNKPAAAGGDGGGLPGGGITY